MKDLSDWLDASDKSSAFSAIRVGNLVAIRPRPVPRYGRGAGALDYMAGQLM